MIGKTLLRWGIAIIAVLAIIVIILLTPPGLKIGMSVATKLLPGHLQYKKISGMITGPIEIKGFQYDHDGTHVSIAHFKMNWRPLTLLWGKLTITKLDANRVYLTLGPSTKKTQKTSANSKLFTIQIDQAKLRNVAIGKQKNQYPVFFPHINFKGTIVPKKIDIQADAIISKPFPTQIRFDATGNFSKYTLTLRLSNRHLNWVIYGKGNEQSIRLQIHESRTLGGSLSANANIRWTPQWQWDIDLNGRNLHFNELKSNWPQLGIQLNTQGQIINQLPHFSAKALITTPKAKINIIAKQDTSLKLQWNAAIDQLATLIPGSHGALYTKGQWSGATDHPTTQGNIKANNMLLYGYRVDTLKGNWHLYSPNGQPSNFNITAKNLSTKTITLHSLQLQGKGTQQSHQLSGKIGINNASFVFQAQGGLFGDQWKGQLKKLNITSTKFTNWHLEKPTTITLSPTQMTTPNLCLRSATKNGVLCFDGQWNSNKAWQFTVKGPHIDSGLLTNLLLPKLTLSGSASINATITGDAGKLQTAYTKLTLSSGRFRYALNGNYIASRFQGGNMSFNLDHTGLRSQINITLSKNNHINVALSLPHSPNPSKDQAISGTIRANLTNLKLLANIAPKIARPSGKVQVNLSIHGTLKHPQVSGKVNFRHGSVKLARLGIELTNIDVELSSYDDVINYTAKMFSKDKPIQVKGKSKWTPKSIESDFTVDANNVLIMNTPEYLIYASPKLKFHILGKVINMQGEVTIPKGLIQPHDFTNVTSLPPGQIVYIGQSSTKDDQSWQISAKLTIILGKDVTVKTSGLQAQVTGQTTLTGSPKHPTLAKGRINITKGEYTAYGKTLLIKPGSFIQFVNSPVSNPNLNIRATKRIPIGSVATGQQFDVNDIIVGILVTGNFHRPKIRLFSIPATLSQADILSYLILGYATNIHSKSNIDLLLEAASALQLGGSGGGIGGVLSQIKQGLGLTELGVESKTMTDAAGTPIDKQTAFVIGKQLTQRIYIRYSRELGQSAFLPVNMFQLRYALGKNWVVQTNSSSLGNGADILYTIQKN